MEFTEAESNMNDLVSHTNSIKTPPRKRRASSKRTRESRKNKLKQLPPAEQKLSSHIDNLKLCSKAKVKAKFIFRRRANRHLSFINSFFVLICFTKFFPSLVIVAGSS